MAHTQKIEKAAQEFMIAYATIYDDRHLTSNQKRSQSLKEHYAKKRLQKVLGFDMGNLPSLTEEQWKMREEVFDKVRELKKAMDN